MRVKVSAPVEVVEAFEAAMQSIPAAALEAPVKRREDAELRFGLKEVADIIVVVKDFAEFVSLCWSGILLLRSRLGKRREMTKSGGGSMDVVQAPVALEITTSTTRIRVALPLESTREQVQGLLAPLLPRSVR